MLPKASRVKFLFTVQKKWSQQEFGCQLALRNALPSNLYTAIVAEEREGDKEVWPLVNNGSGRRSEM